MKNKITLFLLVGLSFGAYAADITAPEIDGRITLMDIAADGEKLYLTYALEEESKQIRFQVLEKNVWKEILLPADTKASSFLEIQIYNSIPYILFTGSEGMTLIKYEKGEWFHVGKPNFAAKGYSLNLLYYVIVDGTPYIILENLENKQTEIWMMETEGNLQIWTSPDASSLIPVGTEQPYICADLNNSVYTAWFDRKNEKVQVSKLINDDEQFQDISKGILSKNVANLIGLTAIGNQLYLAYEDQSRGYAITVQYYNSSSSKWEVLTTPTSMIGTSYNLANNKNIFLLNESKSVAQFSFANNTWEDAEIIHSSASESLTTCSSLESTYVAFLSGEKLIIKLF